MAWRAGRTWMKVALALALEGTGANRVLSAARRRLASHRARVHVLGFHRVVDDLDARAKA